MHICCTCCLSGPSQDWTGLPGRVDRFSNAHVGRGWIHHRDGHLRNQGGISPSPGRGVTTPPGSAHLNVHGEKSRHASQERGSRKLAQALSCHRRHDAFPEAYTTYPPRCGDERNKPHRYAKRGETDRKACQERKRASCDTEHWCEASSEQVGQSWILHLSHYRQCNSLSNNHKQCTVIGWQFRKVSGIRS